MKTQVSRIMSTLKQVTQPKPDSADCRAQLKQTFVSQLVQNGAGVGFCEERVIRAISGPDAIPEVVKEAVTGYRDFGVTLLLETFLQVDDFGKELLCAELWSYLQNRSIASLGESEIRNALTLLKTFGMKDEILVLALRATNEELVDWSKACLAAGALPELLLQLEIAGRSSEVSKLIEKLYRHRNDGWQGTPNVNLVLARICACRAEHAMENGQEFIGSIRDAEMFLGSCSSQDLLNLKLRARLALLAFHAAADDFAKEQVAHILSTPNPSPGRDDREQTTHKPETIVPLINSLDACGKIEQANWVLAEYWKNSVYESFESGAPLVQDPLRHLVRSWKRGRADPGLFPQAPEISLEHRDTKARGVYEFTRSSYNEAVSGYLLDRACALIEHGRFEEARKYMEDFLVPALRALPRGHLSYDLKAVKDDLEKIEAHEASRTCATDFVWLAVLQNVCFSTCRDISAAHAAILSELDRSVEKLGKFPAWKEIRRWVIIAVTAYSELGEYDRAKRVLEKYPSALTLKDLEERFLKKRYPIPAHKLDANMRWEDLCLMLPKR